MRTHTPPRVTATPDGRTSTRFTVQRACNGCARDIGDVTEGEMGAVMSGAPLPDVRGECPWCAPFLTEEA